VSVLAQVYVQELSEGRIPRPDSDEAKEYRAWSWAYEQLRRILITLGQMEESYEEENGEMYR
jgi:hypothetical protein